jgi:hypothetical protein
MSLLLMIVLLNGTIQLLWRFSQPDSARQTAVRRGHRAGGGVLFYFFFGVSNPTFLGIFCGGLMSVDIRLPFYIAATAAVLGLLVMALTWGAPEMRKLTARPAGPTS